jgi:hypothetical protein
MDAQQLRLFDQQLCIQTLTLSKKGCQPLSSKLSANRRYFLALNKGVNFDLTRKYILMVKPN